jgi:hypothetical protein
MTTATERQASGAGLPTAAVRDDARERYRQSVSAELPLSGAALGALFGRGERWGRDRIAEVRMQDAARQEAAPGGTGQVNGVVAVPELTGAVPVAAEAVPVTAAAVPVAARRHKSGTAAVTPAVRRVTVLAVVLVAAVAAVVSYEHMRHLASSAGEGWRSWLLPLSVDGLMVAASMTMLVRKRQGLKAGWLPWVSLLLGIGASLAANVAAAEPNWHGRLVAAWPPLALLMAYELLMGMVKAARDDEEQA